ncbi:hypothetical protein [Vibrio harveyi]|uniref:hypothetical protein n=1 Tax=Vibrio harveyi TaxID=669 RepID=UPI002481818B|nr:hypothetical protein [Vibrio harveyi]
MRLLRLSELSKELESQVNQAIVEFREKHSTELSELEESICSGQQSLEQLVSPLLLAMNEYEMKRSERWHGSSSGESFYDWQDEWARLSDDMKDAFMLPYYFDNIEFCSPDLIELPPIQKVNISS